MIDGDQIVSGVGQRLDRFTSEGTNVFINAPNNP